MFPDPPDFDLRVEDDSMNRLGLVAGSDVAVNVQPTARKGHVVVARLEDEVTLKRFVRVDLRRVELRPETTHPEHQPVEVDLKTDAFEIAGVSVGALFGDGLDWPEHKNREA